MAKSDTEKIEIRIYYEDTDSGRVVYYANYLKFFERARTEFLRARGIDIASLANDERIGFTVVNASARYRRPARLGDLIEVETRAALKGAVRITFDYVVRLAGSPEVLVEGSTDLACVDDRFRPQRAPKIIREILPRS